MNWSQLTPLPKTVYLSLLVLVFIILFNSFPSIAAGTTGMHIYVNDKMLSSDQPPVKIEGRVLMPFRVLFTALGGTVHWEPETATVTGSLKGSTVTLQVGKDIAVVNREIVALDVGARIINGRTMVPLRFMSESLGAGVQYHDDTGTVRISIKAAEGVYLDKRNLTLELGDSETIKAIVTPLDAANRKVKWHTSDANIARVNMISHTEAIVTPISGGTCFIYAVTEDGGFTDTCRVEIKDKDVPVTEISLNRTSITLNEGESPTTIRAIIHPGDATDQNVTWSSSNTAVATVHRSGTSEGMIVPLKEGSTDITATTADGEFAATCRVTVEKYAIPVRGIDMSLTSTTLAAGGSYQTLRVTISPRNASNQSIKWSVEKEGKDVKSEYIAIEIDSREEGYEWARLVPIKESTVPVRVIATTADGNYSASCWVLVE